MEVEFHTDFKDRNGLSFKAGRRAHVTRDFAKKAADHCTIVGSESNRHTMDRTSLIETGMAPDRSRTDAGSDEATQETQTKTKRNQS